jgi:23S rRNA pseudouridine1911/1915/1917 synthase
LRPGLVHRLDRGTSGLIVIAKTDESHRLLAEQFARRKAKKTYIALVHGWLNEDQGTIDVNVGRDLARRTRMTTRRQGGREAITHYKVQRRLDTPYGKFSLLKVKIETGRTHQIRVHMAAIGHPVVGDTLYGAPRELQPKPVKSARTRAAARPLGLSRNFLHAAVLEISHPVTSEDLSFSRPLPTELQQFMDWLEQKD